MNHLLSATALVATLAFTPAIANANNFGANPHEQCKRDEDNRQILGGLAGAVLGGVIGSQVAGSGARTEGSVIAGTIGALAGAGIADKTIDCDPVYPSQQGYPSGSSYSSGTSVHSGSPVYSGHTTQTYGNASTYGSTQTYQDRVTVSNHPVYSDPYYGAGAVSQGSTYSSGTTSYPPSGNNSQYASNTTTYSAPTTTAYASAPRTTYVSQPVTQYGTGYSQSTYDPQFQTVRTSNYYGSRRAQRRGRHYHGRYSCNDRHY